MNIEGAILNEASKEKNRVFLSALNCGVENCRKAALLNRTLFLANKNVYAFNGPTYFKYGNVS